MTITLNAFIILVLDFIFTKLTIKLIDSPSTYFISFLVLALSIVLVILTAGILLQYPSIFPTDLFLPNRKLFLTFSITITISSGLTLFAAQSAKWIEWQTSETAGGIRKNLPGLLLASAITVSTFLLSTAFRSTSIQQMDNYFDTDSLTWINLITARVDNLIPLRAVHPLAFFIFRPLAWLISFALNGNEVYSAHLLTSIFGGVCVYFTWLFFKKRTDNTTYSLLIASLLGISSSHLILSVFLESYIFSAAALIGFLLLLISEKQSLKGQVLAGILSFGITITNFAQICIGYFFLNPDIKKVVKYVTLVLGIATILVFAQHIFYPTSEPFYIPSNLVGEQEYSFSIFTEETPMIVSRANVLTRNIFLMNVVAPHPLILLKKAKCTFPCFYTIFKTHGHYDHAAYSDFGKIWARLWFASLVLAFFFFTRTLLKTPKQAALQMALLANILFNFILHMNYGDDPILYSPDWTYALIFFFGISYEGLANKKWFQAIILIFLTGLLINNLDLFHKMLEAILPFSL
ncbi:MAG: hypothetical protein HZB50_07420 [Chloroflexi bacterium]|nr:hypothetical protein [Chloroflexota bacterium]